MEIEMEHGLSARGMREQIDVEGLEGHLLLVVNAEMATTTPLRYCSPHYQ